jgi:hypothetical protein
MRNLSDEKRRRSKNNTVTETQNDTCRNKHSKVLSSSLKTNSEKHENTTNLYTNLAASPIDQIRHHKKANKRAKTHRGVEQTKNGTSWVVEVLLPVGEGLKTVHHGA